MSRSRHFISLAGVAVLIAVFCMAAIAPAQLTERFKETWNNTTDLPRTLKSGDTQDLITIHFASNTGADNNWHNCFGAYASGAWTVEHYAAPLNSVALRIPVQNVAGAHGILRSPLGTPIAFNASSWYQISFKLCLAYSSGAQPAWVNVMLAADGGDALAGDGFPLMPTQSFQVRMNTGVSGGDDLLGRLSVSGGTEPVNLGTRSQIALGSLFEWTGIFYQEGSGTRIKYIVKKAGSVLHSGNVLVADVITPGTVFDRVLIDAGVRSRCMVDDITIKAGPAPTTTWYFDSSELDFGVVDAAFGETSTQDFVVLGSGTINTITFSGSSASEFSVVAPPLPRTLDVDELTTFAIRWTPTENTPYTLTQRGNKAIFTDNASNSQEVDLLGFNPKYVELRPYVPESALDVLGPKGAVVANVWPFLPAMIACSPTTTFWAENAIQRGQQTSPYLRPGDVTTAMNVPRENAMFSYGINAFFGTDAATRLFSGTTATTRGDVRGAIETARGTGSQTNAWGFRAGGVLDTSGNLFFCMAMAQPIGTGVLDWSVRVPSTATTAYMDALVKAAPNGPTSWTFTVLAVEDGLCYPSKIGSDIYMVKSGYQAIPSVGGGSIVKVNDSTPNAAAATPVAGLGSANFTAALGLSGDAASSFALVSTATDGTNLYVGINNAGNVASNDLIVKITNLTGSPVITPFITAAALDESGDYEPDSIAISPSGKYLVVLSQDNQESGPFLNTGDDGDNARSGLMIYDISGGTPVLWDMLREEQIVGPLAEVGFSSQMVGEDDSLSVTEIGDDLICFFSTLERGTRGILKLRFDTQRASIVSIAGPAQTSASQIDFTITFDKPVAASEVKRTHFNAARLTGDLTPIISAIIPNTGDVTSLTVRVVLPGGQSGNLQLQVKDDAITLPILWKQKPYTDGQIVSVFSEQARAKEWWLY